MRTTFAVSALFIALLAAPLAHAAPRKKAAPAPQTANVKTLPACYTGELKIDGTGEVRPVYLELRGRLDQTTYLTRVFSIGGQVSKISFAQAAKNLLQYNDNDDYIPGGAASFNIDIVLNFAKDAATGTYKSYKYSSETPGTGGFGQGEKAGVVPSESGVFTLKNCRISTADYIKQIEAEKIAAAEAARASKANANRP